MPSTNKRFWDQLLQYVDEGSVIPILGQDLLTIEHKGSQVPFSRFLATELADYLDIEITALPPGNELSSVAIRFINKSRTHDIDDINAALCEVMPDVESIPSPPALLQMAKITAFKLFIVTTFDPLLEHAINQVRFDGKPRCTTISYDPTGKKDLPCPLENISDPTVYHLLGRMSPVPDYVVTEEDMLEFIHALQSPDHRPELLFDELRRHQLLIIGHGFPNWLTRFFIRAAAGDRLSIAPGRSYVADTTVQNDEDLREFLRNFSLKTKVYEEGEPAEFVDQLYTRWTARQPSTPPAADSPAGSRVHTASDTPDRVPRGSVFLSYASEDRDVVQALRDDLLSAGIDVWFDTKAIQPGDDFTEIILDGIESCSLFVPIISRNTLTDDRRYFRKEWRRALEESEKAGFNQTFLLPVAIDDVPYNDRAIPTQFREKDWGRFPDEREQLIAVIKHCFRDYQKRKAGR